LSRPTAPVSAMALQACRREVLPHPHAYMVGDPVPATTSLREGMVMLYDPRNLEFVCQV
jgi:hypothetical protein